MMEVVMVYVLDCPLCFPMLDTILFKHSQTFKSIGTPQADSIPSPKPAQVERSQQMERVCTLIIPRHNVQILCGHRICLQEYN